MSKEMKELLNKINAKKAEIRAFVADGKIEDATSAKEELKKLQASFDILAEIEDEAAGQAQQQAEQQGIRRLHVSISDEKAYATAYVVAEE